MSTSIILPAGASCRVLKKSQERRTLMITTTHSRQTPWPAWNKRHGSTRQCNGPGQKLLQEEWVWCMRSDPVLLGLVVGKSNYRYSANVTLGLLPAQLPLDQCESPQAKDLESGSLKQLDGQSSCRSLRAQSSMTHGGPGLTAREQDLAFYF